MKTVGAVLLTLFIIEAVLLLLLASQANRYAKYWTERQNNPAQPGELLYVALGDSVGVGMGAGLPEKGYVGLLENALQKDTGREIRVINLSRSGAKIIDGIEKQLPVLATYKADFVTIALGANDLKNWDEQAFRHDMKRLMDGLPKHAIVSDLPYFGGGRQRGLEERVTEANSIIRKLAAENNLKVAPLHEVTKTNDSLLIYSSDFFHPNNRGHRNWFEAYWGVLKEQVY